MKTLEELIPLIEQWAEEKGIIEADQPLAQMRKMQEEVGELWEAAGQVQSLDGYHYAKQLEEWSYKLKDAIGDVLVTVIVQAKLQNVDIHECLNLAYDTISKRRGKIIDGAFVKDE